MARLPVWVAAVWWCSLGVVGFFVVPLLFSHLPTPAMAGAVAAKLFTAQTWVVQSVCAHALDVF
jgi:predicted cobalt transporter CbtA